MPYALDTRAIATPIRVVAVTGGGRYSSGDGISTKHWRLELERAAIGDLA